MQHRTIYFISTEDIIFVFQFMYGIQLLKKIGHHLKVLSINISVTSEHKHARFKVEDSIKIPFPTSLTFNFFSFCWFCVNNCQSVAYIIFGFRISWISFSSFLIQCLSCAFVYAYHRESHG